VHGGIDNTFAPLGGGCGRLVAKLIGPIGKV
jgi:hypothetical protein